MKRVFLTSIFLFSIMMIPLACFSVDTINIAMGYIPNVQFAPYYIAKEMGYYQKEGLKVNFDYGMATDIMSLVAGGTVDFGISDGDQVIIAREKGMPVKVVYTMYVRYPVAVVSLKEKGITAPHLLKGTRIGMPAPYGSNYIGTMLILHSAGLSVDEVKLEFIGYTQIESLISGKVDAVSVFINNEPVVLQDLGRKINIIPAYKLTPMVSAAIITSDIKIEQDPDVIRRFIRAIVEASDYILKHREEVLPLLKKYIPTLTEANLEINKKVLLASLELWQDEDSALNGIGYTTLKDWEKSIDTLLRMGLINKKINPHECFTNRFLESD